MNNDNDCCKNCKYWNPVYTVNRGTITVGRCEHEDSPCNYPYEHSQCGSYQSRKVKIQFNKMNLSERLVKTPIGIGKFKGFDYSEGEIARYLIRINRKNCTKEIDSLYLWQWFLASELEEING